MAVLLLGAMAVQSLASGRKSIGSGLIVPGATQVSVYWDFDVPSIRENLDRWFIESEMTVLSKVDGGRVDVTRVSAKRGGEVRDVSFAGESVFAGAPLHPFAMSLDPLPGSGPVTLQIEYTVTFAEGQVLEHEREVELLVDA